LRDVVCLFATHGISVPLTRALRFRLTFKLKNARLGASLEPRAPAGLRQCEGRMRRVGNQVLAVPLTYCGDIVEWIGQGFSTHCFEQSPFAYYWRIVSFVGNCQNGHGAVTQTCNPCRARSGKAGSAKVSGWL
jgi:hypothetical protein